MEHRATCCRGRLPPQQPGAAAAAHLTAAPEAARVGGGIPNAVAAERTRVGGPFAALHMSRRFHDATEPRRGPTGARFAAAVAALSYFSFAGAA